ncbi:MAG: response regulator [Deltaproteobacteria bacterium]|nr:response regulator [Deltaproteobacteria bacterium]
MIEVAPTILNVDDHEAQRYALSRVLRQAGFEVQEAGTGRHALELASLCPSLVILDVHLPDMDGLDVCRRMKSAAPTASIPILVVSATAIACDDRVRGLEGGADAYLTHPVEPRELLAMVRALLRAQQHEEERGRLLEAERIARAEAENAQRRFALVAKASEALASSLDYPTTIQNVARLALPEFADFCVVDLVEGDSVHRVAYAHRDRAREGATRRHQRHAPDREHGGVVVRVLRTGQSELVGQERDGPDNRITQVLEPESRIVVPLVARGRTLGALSFAFAGSGRQYTEDDLPLAEELGRRAALSIDNARLHLDAQKAIKDREDLIAIVSHDLRNPLNAAMTSSWLLCQTPLEGEEGVRLKRRAELIHRSAERMRRLIDDLLDFASIVGGRLHLDRKPHDLGPLITDVVEMLRETAGQQGVRLDVEHEAPDLTANCDRERVLQTLSNLVGNAIKFTGDGGLVLVRAARAEGPWVRLEVCDTGVGIPSEHLPNLFDRYWQVSRDDRRGLGLGLFIARALVEAHGGTIGVQSAVGTGSTFFFTLPAAA